LAQPLLGKARISAWEGKFEEARENYNEAIQIFETHIDVNFIYVAQSELAHLYRKYGYWEEARGLYKQTIRRWQEIGQLAAVAHQLECFSFLAISDGLPQRAAKLLGAAEALRERLNSKMTVYERTDYDEQTGVLHSMIDEAAYAAAWTEGRNLAIDAAVLYALDGTSER
jgi:tetratricopeptide (TPR) repeat protein